MLHFISLNSNRKKEAFTKISWNPCSPTNVCTSVFLLTTGHQKACNFFSYVRSGILFSVKNTSKYIYIHIYMYVYVCTYVSVCAYVLAYVHICSHITFKLQHLCRNRNKSCIVVSWKYKNLVFHEKWWHSSVLLWNLEPRQM